MSLGKILVALYRILGRRRLLLYLLLTLLTVAMVAAASGIRFTEDPMQLFPSEGEGAKSAMAFSRLKAKDKIIVLISSLSDETTSSSDMLADAAESFKLRANILIDEGLLSRQTGSEIYNQKEILDFIYSNLPLYLEVGDYSKINESIKGEKIAERL